MKNLKETFYRVSYLAASIGSLLTHRRKGGEIQFQEITFHPKAEKRFKLTQ